MQDQIKLSPLNNLHVRLGAKMVEFAGWSMPVMYRGIIDEHQHTRNACSLFDVSHMGRLRIKGPDAERLLQRVCTRNLSDMVVGQSRYSHVCRDDGGVLDDVIVSRFDNHYLVVCNASNREKILAWLGRQIVGFEAGIEDQTFQTAMIAIQGPQAVTVLQRLLGVDLSGVQRYHFHRQTLMTFPCSFFRSGYTGEDGFEIIVPTDVVKLALPALLGLGENNHETLRPAGLGARDTLRLEAGMPLYGHELGEDWDSLTAGLNWCVDLSKDFIGAAAMRRLKEHGFARRLVGLEIEGRRTARQGFPVLADGRSVGKVTSGCLSPTLGKSIAMALLQTEHAAVGTALSVDFGGKPLPARVVKLPFYKRLEKAK